MTQLRSGITLIASFHSIVLLLALSQPAGSTVYVHWSHPQVPAASSLGVTDIVFTWNEGISAAVTNARKQGYSVYVETPISQAKAAADEGAKAGWVGVILDVSDSENAESEKSIAVLRTTYPKLRFLLLNGAGKQPDMRGSLIVKRNSVLEVSSPTAQPWIDSNVALIRVEQRVRRDSIPVYTFSWEPQEQLRTATVDDYSLAVAEAGALHANLMLQLDENLQQGLNNRDAKAWALWNQVQSTLKFSVDTNDALKPAANVAVVVDHLDAGDEVLNLLSRHNIPFQVFLAADLRIEDLKGFDVLVVFAKPDREIAERIKSFAACGATVVAVDAHGIYPWQNSPSVRENEHTISYVVGSGKVLELSEPVTDPETFAQDIRRLLGKRNALLSLWNGLTTLAIPYKDAGGSLRVLEVVNYATDPLRVQVQVRGSFKSARYESPERPCCESLAPVQHDGFTEFIIPNLRIAGRIHLEP